MIKHASAILLVSLALAIMAFAADTDQLNAPATQPHKLPADGKAVIVTYDYVGGMLRRLNSEPVLVVHADGTVHAGDPFESDKGCDGKLTAEELQSLLHDILDVQHFATIENQDFALPPNIRVNDAQTVSVALSLPELDKTLSAHGLMVNRNAAADDPKARFTAIRNRLDQVACVTLLGGDAELAKELDAINPEIKKNFTNEPQLDAGDLATVHMTPDKSSTATFTRKVTDAKGWHALWATVTRTATGELTVKIQPGPEQPNQ